MSVTTDFLKDRVKGNPVPGQWNQDYTSTLNAAKACGKFLVAVWSNGDNCGYCTAAEKCMMDESFKAWMKESDAYFLFQCSADSDKGKKVHDWVYKKDIHTYPGFLIVRYESGKSAYAVRIEGNTLRESKTGATGAKKMVANLKKLFEQSPVPKPEPEPEPTDDFKVRLNEAITTKQANAIMDAIDKNDGYCPCQEKGPDTKCHCADFLNNKKIGETCICKLYTKMKK